MEKIKRGLPNFIKYFFPRTVFGIYVMGGVKTFIIWRQWFDKCYDTQSFEVK